MVGTASQRWNHKVRGHRSWGSEVMATVRSATQGRLGRTELSWFLLSSAKAFLWPHSQKSVVKSVCEMQRMGPRVNNGFVTILNTCGCFQMVPVECPGLSAATKIVQPLLDSLLNVHSLPLSSYPPEPRKTRLGNALTLESLQSTG